MWFSGSLNWLLLKHWMFAQERDGRTAKGMFNVHEVVKKKKCGVKNEKV